MDSQDASVSQWLRQMQGGHRDAPVQKLWERYFRRLMGLARIKLGKLPKGPADEEDVALSAFDSFYHGVAQGRFPQLNDRQDLWHILVTITARKAFRLNRRNQRQKRGGNITLNEADLAGNSAEAGGMSLEQFLAKGPSPDFAAQAAEEYKRLIELLPETELREVAQWKMEGFTNEEIAGKLKCVLRSVERKLKLIRSLWEPGEA